MTGPRPRARIDFTNQSSSLANHCSSKPSTASKISRGMTRQHPGSTPKLASIRSRIHVQRRLKLDFTPGISTRGPAIAAPSSTARINSRSVSLGTMVSASTKISSRPSVAAAPALRTAAICRFSTDSTVAPAFTASRAVASSLASSTTSSSLGRPSSASASRSAETVATMSAASFQAGTTTVSSIEDSRSIGMVTIRRRARRPRAACPQGPRSHSPVRPCSRPDRRSSRR